MSFYLASNISMYSSESTSTMVGSRDFWTSTASSARSSSLCSCFSFAIFRSSSRKTILSMSTSTERFSAEISLVRFWIAVEIIWVRFEKLEGRTILYARTFHVAVKTATPRCTERFKSWDCGRMLHSRFKFKRW